MSRECFFAFVPNYVWKTKRLGNKKITGIEDYGNVSCENKPE